MRVLIIDTLVTIIFFTIVATFSELIIAGMEPSKVLETRLLMVPIMILTGRPYTRWRDWFVNQLQPQSFWCAALVDTASFLSFQAPVYAATLLIAGANLAEVSAAIGSAVIFMIILARPFGLFVDWARDTFGIGSTQRSETR